MSGSGRLLVVDASLETLDSVERSLRTEGYEVDATPRVGQALVLLDHLPYDLVLTGLEFPGRGGLVLVRHVCDQLEATRVIVIAAPSDVETAVRVVKAGAAEYLVEPSTPDVVLDAVRRVLGAGAAGRGDSGSIGVRQDANEEADAARGDAARARQDRGPVPDVADGQRLANADVALAFARSRRLEKLKRYVRAHIDERVTLETAASVVGLQPTYFSEWFVDRTGLRFSDWVTECRIGAAETLFLTENTTILETALAVGFGTARTFQRACHRHRGMTPSELKARVRQHW